MDRGTQDPNATQRPNGIQLPNGIQGPNSVQQSNGIQHPSSIHAPTASQSPLGEPISPASAAHRAEDPLNWHLTYWLNLGIIGTIRGVDPLLMVLRIEMEHNKISSDALKTQVRSAWPQFEHDNEEECKQHWAQVTLEDGEAEAYLRDLDRMLVDKGPKMRVYLCRLENALKDLLRGAHVGRARFFLDRIGRAYQKLLEEEREDAEARNCLPNGLLSNGHDGV